jgi:hypothetical protein
LIVEALPYVDLPLLRADRAAARLVTVAQITAAGKRDLNGDALPICAQ